MTFTDDELIVAIEAHGVEGAARTLGVNRRTVQRRKAMLALKGYSPKHNMTHTVPDGFKVKGVSTLYREDGTVAAQWVKSAADAERREAMFREWIESAASSVPRIKPVAAPKRVADDLLGCFVISDYHLGMLAWAEETRGESWDLGIAKALLVDWFNYAIQLAPPAKRCAFVQLGDFLHIDGLTPATPEHGNILDADTRFQKIVRAAYDVQAQVINLLLRKHERVDVILAEGNHDPASSAHMRESFRFLYGDEPRVHVDTSPDPYYCIEHGQTSLFFHHGHKLQPEAIAQTFAAKFRAVMGRTKYSYAHMGHRHNYKVITTPLMEVTQHATLAAPDAYASRGGWLADRFAGEYTYHKNYGRFDPSRITPAMVRDWKAAA